MPRCSECLCSASSCTSAGPQRFQSLQCYTGLYHTRPHANMPKQPGNQLKMKSTSSCDPTTSQTGNLCKTLHSNAAVKPAHPSWCHMALGYVTLLSWVSHPHITRGACGHPHDLMPQTQSPPGCQSDACKSTGPLFTHKHSRPQQPGQGGTRQHCSFLRHTKQTNTVNPVRESHCSGTAL